MAEQIGFVVKTELNDYAQVVLDRKGACGGCQPSSGGCRSCLASAKIHSRVANPVSAKVGDHVKIHLSSANLFSGAAILYLIPVLGLLIGAFTGAWASSAFGFSDSFGSIVGAMSGLAVGFAVVIILGRRPGIRQRMVPTITQIVTPSIGKLDLKNTPCCG